MNTAAMEGVRPPDMSLGPNAELAPVDAGLQVVLDRLADTYPEQSKPYVDALTGLYHEMGNIRWMFPDETAEAAVADTRAIVTGSALLVERHLAQGGTTHETLQLRGDRHLPVSFSGAEPLLALEDLRLTYWMAGQVHDNPDIVAVLANSEDDRRIWRFIDTSGKLPPCAALYVRDTGSTKVDSRYDYGRKHGYTQAKLGLNVDVDVLRSWFAGEDGGEVSIERSPEGNYANVPIRNEHEPVKPSGGAAHLEAIRLGKDFVPMHDIAAVNGDGRTTRVGWLVAYSHDLVKGGRSSHIHLEGVFPDDHSDPRVFAASVRASESKLTARRVASLQSFGQAAAIPEPAGLHEFRIGDNPYDMAEGIHELAHSVGIELGGVPTDEELDKLFDVMGKEAVFRRNVAGFNLAARNLSQRDIARLILRTGVTGPMRLRTVEGSVKEQGADIEHAIVPEGTVGWTEKRAVYLRQLHQRGVRVGGVILAATARQLDTPTEIGLPNVVRLHRELGRTPTAAEYMREIIAPALLSTGMAVRPVVELPAEVPDGDGGVRRASGLDLAGAVAAAHPELADGRVVIAQNAPACWTFGTYLKGLTAGVKGFDGRQQLLFGGNGVHLAETPAELSSNLYQNTYTAASAIPRMLKVIHSVNQQYR